MNEEEGLKSLHAVMNNLLKQIINRSEILMVQLHQGIKAFIVYHQLFILLSSPNTELILVGIDNPVLSVSFAFVGEVGNHCKNENKMCALSKPF